MPWLVTILLQVCASKFNERSPKDFLFTPSDVWVGKDWRHLAFARCVYFQVNGLPATPRVANTFSLTQTFTDEF
jgi:hypothetical protein